MAILAWATYEDMSTRCKGDAFKFNPYFVMAIGALLSLGGFIKLVSAQLYFNFAGTLMGIFGATTCPE